MAAKKTTVGLDIGRYSVKAAWAESRGGPPVVTRTEHLRLPLGGVDAKNVIMPWIEGQKIASHPCIINLPGTQCMFQPFTLPPGDPRSLEDAAAMEAMKFNDIASETMTYGFTPIEINPGEKRLLMGMARPSVLDGVLSIAREPGLEIIDVVPTPVALFRVMRDTAKTDNVAMFIDIGGSETNIAIGSDQKGLMLARAFASGGQLFTDALARESRVAGAQAENQKVREGSLLPDGMHADVLRSAADMWLSEVESCLSVYQSLFPGSNSNIGRIVVTGGASELPGLPEYIEAKLGTGVTVAEAVKNATTIDDPANYAVASGLALSCFESTGEHISLLPAEIRDELMFKQKKPYWIASGVVAALIFGVSVAGGFRYGAKQSDHLREQKASLKRRQDLAIQIENLQKRTDMMLEMAAPVKTLLHSGPMIRDLLSLVAEKRATTDQILMISDADSYFYEEEWKEEEEEKTLGFRDRRRMEERNEQMNQREGIQRVLIKGLTRETSLSTVKQLITELKELDFVASADLLADDELVSVPGSTSEGRVSERSFVIDVSLVAL